MTRSVELLERSAELGAVEAFCAAAADGRSGILHVAGPAGVGKSSLLGALRASSRVPVVEVRGSELEREVPLAVVRRTLAGLRRRGLLPHRLRAVDGLPTLERGSPAPIATALAEALAELAGPVILAVDDLHWVDEPSLWFLAAVAERGDLPIALALASRTGDPGAAPAVAARITTRPGAVALRPRELGPAAVRRLVAGEIPGADDATGDEVVALTGGNPFLVRELLAAVAGGDRAALDPVLADRGVPDRIARWVAARLDELDVDARGLANALAVLGESPLRRCAALAGFDVARGRSAAAALVGAGIVAPGEPLAFAHPLTLHAVAARLAPHARASRHRCAAALLAEDGEAVEFVAAQLLRARPFGDPWTVDVLVEAAASARRRGMPDEAATILDRAIREPPVPDRRAGILLELARCEHAVGAPATVDRYRAVLDATAAGDPSDADLRVAAWHGIAVALHTGGDGPGAGRAAATGRAELLDGDPREELLLGDEIASALFFPGTQARAHALSDERVARMRGGDDVRDPLLAAALAGVLANRAVALDVVPGLVAAATAERAAVRRDAAVVAVSAVASALWTTDDLHGARAVLDAALHDALEVGDAGAELLARGWSANVLWALGDLDAADARLAGIEAAEEAFPGVARVSRAARFRIRLVRGDARGAGEALRPLLESGTELASIFEVGTLHLLQGRPEEALEAYRAAGAADERLGVRHPGMCTWRWGAALALAAVGDRAAGVALAEEHLAAARAAGPGRHLARALATLGRLVPPEAGLPLLAEAVAASERSPAAVQRPEIRFHHGAALRRAGRPRAAREVLATARDEARAIGAGGLLVQIEDELVAAAPPGASSFDAPAGLTASELRVARLAADGRTSARVAAALGLSVRTVESHLASAYRKLDVPGRDGLAAALGTPLAGDADAAAAVQATEGAPS